MMPMFFEKPKEVSAEQFWEKGDAGIKKMWSAADERPCLLCDCPMRLHGLTPMGRSIEQVDYYNHTPDGYLVVCPGVWVVRKIDGAKYTYTEKAFFKKYAPMEHATCS